MALSFRTTAVLVFVSTFILFSVEAFIHYNIGRPEKHLVWPARDATAALLGTIALFSALNSAIVAYLESL